MKDKNQNQVQEQEQVQDQSAKTGQLLSRRKALATLGVTGAALVGASFMKGGMLGAGTAFAANTTTMAALKSITSAPDDWYYVTDDGYEGLFRYMPGSTLTDNRGIVVVSTGGYVFKRCVDGYYNVKWWGVVGDGTTLDTSSIQYALSVVKDMGGGVLFFPRGTYIVHDTLFIRDNVTIMGEGDATIIKAQNGVNGYPFLHMGISSTYTTKNGSTVQPYSCKNAVIRDLVLDGNVSGRSTMTSGNGCIFLQYGAQYNLIENVTIQNFGTQDISRNGNYITLAVSEDSPDDSHSNIIRNCRFWDAGRYSDFAVRFYTAFDLKIADEEFTRFVRNNTIEDCVFEGFTWNAIELAGPGTVYNLVRNNSILDINGLGGFEADKGASYNRFEGNRVMKMSMPVAGSSADTANVSIWAYRAQGTSYDTGKYRYPRGNIFVNNFAANLPTPKSSSSHSGGLLLDKAIDTIIENNHFRDMSDPNSPAYFAAIYVINSLDRVSINGGIIQDCNDGIIFTGGSGVSYTNVTVSGVVSSTSRRFYRSLTGGSKKGITLIGNNIEITSDYNAIDLSDEDIQIVGNKIWTTATSTLGAINVRSGNKVQVVGNHTDGFKYGVTDASSISIITSNRFTSTTGSVSAPASARNLTLLNITTIPTGLKDPLQTNKAAMPTSGTWVKNDLVHNTALTVLTDSKGSYIVARWIRLTDGANHVLGTDWAEERVYL